MLTQVCFKARLRCGRLQIAFNLGLAEHITHIRSPAVLKACLEICLPCNNKQREVILAYCQGFQQECEIWNDGETLFVCFKTLYDEWIPRYGAYDGADQYGKNRRIPITSASEHIEQLIPLEFIVMLNLPVQRQIICTFLSVCYHEPRCTMMPGPARTADRTLTTDRTLCEKC